VAEAYPKPDIKDKTVREILATMAKLGGSLQEITPAAYKSIVDYIRELERKVRWG